MRANNEIRVQVWVDSLADPCWAVYLGRRNLGYFGVPMRTGLAFFALLPACLSPQVAEDTGDTSVGGDGSGATIAQIKGDIGQDETVTLSNVVVTSGLT